MSGRGMLPCELIAPAIPQLVEAMLGAPLGQVRSVELEQSAGEPILWWRRFHWQVGAGEASLCVPTRRPNRALCLRIRSPDGLAELEGPADLDGPPFDVRGGRLVSYRAEGDLCERLASFFEPVKLARIPALPRKWARMRRSLISPLATHSWVAPGTSVRFAEDRTTRTQSYALSTSPVGVVPLGTMEVFSDPVRLCLVIDGGRPLPRLRDLFPLWDGVDVVQPLADETGHDRTFGPGDIHGMLHPLRGRSGREWFDVALAFDHLLREVRIGEVGTDVDDPAAPWSVEWCVTGNGSYVNGHPGGGTAMFARSLPTSPRVYDVILHGTTETSLARWRQRLAAVGLRSSGPGANRS